MEYGACGWPGCSKPITAQDRVACGNVHHFLVMVSRYLAMTRNRGTCSSSAASRAPEAADDEEQEEGDDDDDDEAEQGGRRDNPTLLRAQQQTLDQFSTGPRDVCPVPSCKRAPWPGHRWCSRTHFLEWLRTFYQNLCPRQRCRYLLCTRHVFVEPDPATGRRCIQAFCGWRHRQKYEMKTALGEVARTSVDKGIYPAEPSLEYLIKALKDYILTRRRPEKGVEVDENFFRKHPWQVLQHPAEEYCLLIARCIYKDKGVKRELMTKEEYHWKQQGRPTTLPVEAISVSRRYLTYQKLQPTKKRVKEHADYAFSLTEWMILDQGCKEYCLLKLAGQVAASMPNKHAKSMAASCEVTAESTGVVTQGEADMPVSRRGRGDDVAMMSCRAESSFNGDISSCHYVATQEQDMPINRGCGDDLAMISCREASSFAGDISASATAHLDAIYSDLEPLQNIVDYYDEGNCSF